MGQPIDTAEVYIVPDLSDFPRLLKAEIDQALRGVQGAVAQAFGRVEALAGQAGAEVGMAFQAGGERAEDAFRETSRTARREFAEIDAAATATSASLSSKLGGALAVVKTSLIGAGVAAAAGLGAITAFGLKSAASLEQTTIGLQALLGSADETTKFIAQLQSFAAATPFEFGDVADASRRILAFAGAVGIARDQVIPTLTTIGDLVSVLGGTAESVESVIRALSQMASKGKVSQEEVMQLAEALPGFNANAAIASQLGLSVADTLDKISAGGVDAQTGVQALLKGMAAFPGAAGAMAAQAQTLSGVFSTFKDTVGIALTNAFQPVIPEIKSTLTELTPVIGDAVGQLAPSLGHALSAILPLIGKLITAIVPILTPIIDALGPALDALGPALVPLGEAIGEVVVALGPSLPLLGQFVAALAQLAVPVLLLLAAILKPLTPLINFMTEAIAEFNKALSMIDWAGVGRAIGTWAEGAWNDISGFFTKWAKGIFDFGAMLGTALKDYLNKVGEFIGNVVAFVKALPGRIVDAAVDFINTLYNAGRNIIQGLINGIGSMGSAVWNYVKGFADRYITQPIKEALGIASPSQVMADEVGRQIPAGIEQGIKAGLPSLESLAAPIIPVGAAGNAGMGGLALGGITINLNFYGDQPTEGQARSLASAAGDALLGRLATQRTIALAGRTA